MKLTSPAEQNISLWQERVFGKNKVKKICLDGDRILNDEQIEYLRSLFRNIVKSELDSYVKKRHEKNRRNSY